MAVHKPTIHDVAAKAGVSKSLVSMALRGSDRVSAESRKTIERAAAELGYRPNAAARSLADRRSWAIGVLVLDFNNPIFGWKVSFLIPAVLLALFFHMMNNRKEGYWESSSKRLWSARAIALLSLFLWIMVAMAGRWIAYAEYIYYPA